MKKSSFLLALLLLVGVLLAACEDTPTPTAVTSQPTAAATQGSVAIATQVVGATSAPAPAVAATDTPSAPVPAATGVTSATPLTPEPPPQTRTPDVKVETTDSGTITRTLLADIDASQWIQDSFTVSPDKRHVGYISARGIRYVMIIDGVRSPEYIGILENTLLFSPDGTRNAYAVSNPVTQALVLDGVEQPGHQAIEAGLVFSADSKHVAYGAADYVTRTAALGTTPTPASVESPGATPATRQGRHFVVLDGTPGPDYGVIASGSISFSANGGLLLYAAKKGDLQVAVQKEMGKPEQESKPYSSIFSLNSSPDGKRVGFAAITGTKRFVVVDGKEGKEYDGVGQSSPVFSPDSAHFAYIAAQDNQQFVVLDGAEGKRYEAILGNPVFSPDGKHLAYAARSGGRYFVVTHELASGSYPANGKEGAQYDLVGSTIAFSPDSMRLAFVGGLGGKQFVVLDGQPGRQYDGIGKGTLTFSPDSKRFAYIAGAEGKQFVVADGVEGKRYDGIGQGTVAFSTDGKHLVYAGAVKVPVTPVPQTTPGSSPATTEVTTQFLVLDGAEGAQNDVVGKNGIAFTSPSDLHYLVVHNRPELRLSSVYLVEQHLK